MTLKLGDEAPNFNAVTTKGEIKFHEWIGESWAILFSHPKSFTPVCTTELGYMAGLKKEFDKSRIEQKPHRIHERYGLQHITPYQHQELDTWRNSFKGIECQIFDSNLYLLIKL